MPDGDLGPPQVPSGLGVGHCDDYNDTIMVDSASVLILLVHFKVSMCLIIYSCLKQIKVRSVHSYNKFAQWQKFWIFNIFFHNAICNGTLIKCYC